LYNAAPKEARVVVVGGGIIGCSVAYHLAHAGWTDVVVVERDDVTSGTTWHAAGLVGSFGTLSETSLKMRDYSFNLYRDVLEKETEQATGFRGCGFIELATSADTLEEYRRVATFNRHMGIDVEEITPQRVKELMPLVKVDDVVAGFYTPTHGGRVNPVDACMALAKGARQLGVKFLTKTAVADVVVRDGAIAGVVVRDAAAGDDDASDVTIKSEFVVNCAGMWTRQLAARAGVTVPLQAAEHYYLITDAMDNVDPMWPVVEDPSSHGYYREEGGGIMVGLFEPEAAAWNVDTIPGDFNFGEIEPDWDRMAPFVETAMARIPATLDVGVKKFFCGPESFTHDNAPLIGEASGVRNLFIAAGLNSIGILTGPGVGRMLAEWIINGKPSADVTGIDVSRAQPFQATPAYRGARVVEALGNTYKCHYPNKNAQSARNAKRSPLHDRLAARGASFKDVSGWESAEYYAENVALTATPTTNAPANALTWRLPDCSSVWAAEHDAVRNGVGLVDMSFMTKILVQGDNAGAFLDFVCAGAVDGDTNVITYTQWLDDDARVHGDVTVMKLPGNGGCGDAPRFMVIVTDTQHSQALAWLRRSASALRWSSSAPLPMATRGSGSDRSDKVTDVPRGVGDGVVITDVTGAYAQINLQGPRSRALLQALTDADVSDDAFPFRAVRDVAIGFARVNVARITYVGELGYELYVPVEQAVHVYDHIVSVATDSGGGTGGDDGHQLVHCGLKALGSLRMEKGYRDFGHDVDNMDTVQEVGLGFAVALDKPRSFRGRGAYVALKAAGMPCNRLVQVLVKRGAAVSDSPTKLAVPAVVATVDAPPLLYHGEVLWRDGVAVGYNRVGSFGFTLDGSLGLAMVSAGDGVTKVTKKWLRDARWQVEVNGALYVCHVSVTPMYDPKNERIKM
jgi:4-methylaminobutanoate oxidase (formaldehyde-forming)